MGDNNSGKIKGCFPFFPFFPIKYPEPYIYVNMSNSFLLHGWESFVLLEDTGCYAIFPYFVTFQIKRYELSVRNISPRIKRGEK